MTATINTSLELDFVNTFVVRPKRARYAGFVVSPSLRPKFLAALHGGSDFDPRLKVRLPRSQDSSRGYLSELRGRGAGPNGYVLSTSSEIDGRTLPIDDAVGEVHGRWDGTLIICTPTLAYYEGELGYRFILFYPSAPGHVRAMTR
jgi:hypothetical protein